MEDWGGNVSFVVNDEITLDVLRGGEYTGILFDLAYVPYDRAFEIISLAREHAPQLRVVAASAAPDFKIARETFNRGAHDYIDQTLDPRELTEYLRKNFFF